MDSALRCQALFTVTPALVLRKPSPRGVKRRGSLEQVTKDTLRDDTQEGKVSPWKGALPLNQDSGTRRNMKDTREAWPWLRPSGHGGKRLRSLRKAQWSLHAEA